MTACRPSRHAVAAAAHSAVMNSPDGKKTNCLYHCAKNCRPLFMANNTGFPETMRMHAAGPSALRGGRALHVPKNRDIQAEWSLRHCGKLSEPCRIGSLALWKVWQAGAQNCWVPPGGVLPGLRRVSLN